MIVSRLNGPTVRVPPVDFVTAEADWTTCEWVSIIDPAIGRPPLLAGNVDHASQGRLLPRQTSFEGANPTDLPAPSQAFGDASAQLRLLDRGQETGIVTEEDRFAADSASADGVGEGVEMVGLPQGEVFHVTQATVLQRGAGGRREPVLVLGVVLDPAGCAGREDSDVLAAAEGRALERTVQLVVDIPKVRYGQIHVSGVGRSAVGGNDAPGRGRGVLHGSLLERIGRRLADREGHLVAQKPLVLVGQVKVCEVLFKLGHFELEAPLGNLQRLSADRRGAYRQPVQFRDTTSEREAKDTGDRDGLTTPAAISLLGSQKAHEAHIRNRFFTDVARKSVVFINALWSTPYPSH